MQRYNTIKPDACNIESSLFPTGRHMQPVSLISLVLKWGLGYYQQLRPRLELWRCLRVGHHHCALRHPSLSSSSKLLLTSDIISEVLGDAYKDIPRSAECSERRRPSQIIIPRAMVPRIEATQPKTMVPISLGFHSCCSGRGYGVLSGDVTTAATETAIGCVG